MSKKSNSWNRPPKSYFLLDNWLAVAVFFHQNSRKLTLSKIWIGTFRPSEVWPWKIFWKNLRACFLFSYKLNQYEMFDSVTSLCSFIGHIKFVKRHCKTVKVDSKEEESTTTKTTSSKTDFEPSGETTGTRYALGIRNYTSRNSRL